MDLKNTFKVAEEDISKMISKYYDESNANDDKESINEVDILRKQFVSELDMLHSKLLQLGKYSREDVQDRAVTNIKRYEGLASYTKLNLCYEYEKEQLALVEDTGGGLHLIPLDIIKYHN